MIPKEVLEAYNLTGPIEPLQGGQNTSYKCGDYVIKPQVCNQKLYSYIYDMLEDFESDQYILSLPVKNKYHSYFYDDYVVTKYYPGTHNDDEIESTIRLCKLFHNDLEKLEIINPNIKPFDQWSRAFAFLFNVYYEPRKMNDLEQKIFSNITKDLPPLLEEYTLIHGDFGGNVLYRDNDVPVIIDFSPDFAPKKMALAITLCDFIAWGNKPMSLLSYFDPLEDNKPYIMYAIAFRILTMLYKKNHTIEEVIEEYNHYIPIWNHISNSEQNKLPLL